MRISRGKPVFGFKDTYCADSSLSHIIASWLRKYLDTITEPNCEHRKGVPGSVATDYIGRPDTQSDEEFDHCWQCYLSEIREIIWAFDPSDEPCYSGGYYEGEHHGEESGHGDSKCHRWDMIPNDNEAWEQSLQDRRDWQERRQRGFDLFAKRFNNLWW
jgi:hypothetical protein